jgi:hypothetical protein
VRCCALCGWATSAFLCRWGFAMLSDLHGFVLGAAQQSADCSAASALLLGALWVLLRLVRPGLGCSLPALESCGSVVYRGPSAVLQHAVLWGRFALGRALGYVVLCYAAAGLPVFCLGEVCDAVRPAWGCLGCCTAVCRLLSSQCFVLGCHLGSLALCFDQGRRCILFAL